MFIKFVDIVFLCNSYPCVLFESLSHVINQESRLFVKFVENFPLKHVITSTNNLVTQKISCFEIIYHSRKRC